MKNAKYKLFVGVVITNMHFNDVQHCLLAHYTSTSSHCTSYMMCQILFVVVTCKTWKCNCRIFAWLLFVILFCRLAST